MSLQLKQIAPAMALIDRLAAAVLSARPQPSQRVRASRDQVRVVAWLAALSLGLSALAVGVSAARPPGARTGPRPPAGAPAAVAQPASEPTPTTLVAGPIAPPAAAGAAPPPVHLPGAKADVAAPEGARAPQ